MVTAPTDDFEEILRGAQFVGIVEDNADPDKKQRCRIRIPFLHGTTDDIPTNSIPWAQPKRDLNGLTCVIPDKGKVVNVVFPSANPYYPIYDSAEHLNVNLQNKLESYSGDDYNAFIALLYNYDTQIYVETDGLVIQHKEQKINMHNGGISLQLADNSSKLVLGDDNADQKAVLGTAFFDWMDTFMDAIEEAYIGNNGAPCVAAPDFIAVVEEYNALRDTFLSTIVTIVDNEAVETNTVDVENQTGDKYTMTDQENTLAVTQAPQDNAAVRQAVSDHIKDELGNNAKKVDLTTDASTVPPDNNDNISKYITFAQAIYSPNATAKGIDNSPTDPQHTTNMKAAGTNIFDKAYDYMLATYGIKIKVNSFYRSAALNAATVGASTTSQHMVGQAIDINAGQYNSQLFFYIKDNLTYDQIIWEYGNSTNPNWVHASYTVTGSNRSKQTQCLAGGKYVSFNLPDPNAPKTA